MPKNTAIGDPEPAQPAARSMGDRRRLMRRGLLPLVLAVLILAPALLATQILWQTLSQQIDAGYEKRLETGLQMYELVLRNRYHSMHEALSLVASDNTLRVTLELEILPQLRRYLRSRHEATTMDFIAILGPQRDLLAGNGPEQEQSRTASQHCPVSPHQARDSLQHVQGRLYLVRTQPIVQKERGLGFVCGGFALDSASDASRLQETLGGVPVVWPGDGDRVSSPLMKGWGNATGADRMFDHRGDHAHFKGMLHGIRIGAIPLNTVLLIDTRNLQIGVRDAIYRIASVFGLIALIGLLGLRYQHLQRRTQAQLAEEKEQALVTLSSIGDAVMTTDLAGRITYMNPAAESLTRRRLNKARPLPWRQYFAIREEDGQDLPDPVQTCLGQKRKVECPGRTLLVRHDDSETAVQLSSAPVADAQSITKGAVLVMRDVNQERHLQRRLEWKASRDDLTGLYNRSEFRHRLERSIEEARDSDIQHGLLYLDLDQFKVVNDSSGHHVGDQLLKNVSNLLKAHLRNTDTLARLGGDEFGVLLEGCPPARSIELANTIKDDISEHRFSHQDKLFNIGVSIGIANIHAHSGDVEDLMSHVDAACYTAKEMGRNRVHFAEDDSQQSQHRLVEMQWASRIKDALRQDQFALYYQPIVPVDVRPGDEAREHGEILVRMLDEDGSPILPGAFMPAAERYGLMPDIDRWIIRRLFLDQGERYRKARQRHAQQGGDTPCLYTINLSGASLADPAFLGFVQSAMGEANISPHLVCFEITETVAITQMDQASHFMRSLKGLGCRFLLDDFGAGMSSFAYLKKLPVDFLKIDGMFVKDMATDPIDRAMVRSINEIGHIMGLKTVAEFVENQAILHELRGMGVDYAQGFGIARPMPLGADETNEAIERTATLATPE